MSAKDNNRTSPELSSLADPHDEFRQLCARKIAEDLSMAEQEMLSRHLLHCQPCRELIAQYEQVVATVIPAMAAGQESGERGAESGAWSIEDAEARLMASLDAEAPIPDSQPVPSRPTLPIWRYARAAAIVLGAGLTGYLAGRQNHSESRELRRQAAQPPPPAQQIYPLRQATTAQRQPDDPARQAVQIRQEQKQVSHLQDELSRANHEIAEQDAALRGSLAERDALNRELNNARAGQERLESNAAATGNQVSEDTRELLGLKTRIEDLDQTLEVKDSEIAEEQELLNRDRDIRNLIGARDLYIAEIFDIGQSGDTQKPFGRIFYTKDRSLIFYGYDLDQQHGVKKDASFQAWGRREGDRKPDVSLGVFYQDDAGNKRWILKFNDPSLLEQLDAVFITAEPKGGSPKPSGKPILFTYLRIDANHP